MNIRYGVRDPKKVGCTSILGGYVFSKISFEHGLKENCNM
jgi:hypothetical protein